MAESKERSLGQKLGEFSFKLYQFPNLQEKLDCFESVEFLKLSERERIEKVHQLLLSCIEAEKSPCFLLAAVNEFIHCVNIRNWLENYSFSKFELWLNLFSGLTFHENYAVRSKIMGRFVPRDAYQILFPVGMNRKHSGSHYVTAHSSPDLDTTVASFWGWVDAFSAKVGEGLHVWNVPGGPPESQVEVQLLFYNLLGPRFFEHFAKTRTSLALSAVDLLTRDGLIRKKVDESVQALDFVKGQKVVLVDSEGNFLADWRQLDVEGVRKVTALLHSCLRWFASYFQRHLIGLFSEPIVTQEKAKQWSMHMFSLHLEEAEPVKGFTEKQKKQLEDCLVKVLKISEGWKATFYQFWLAMEALFLSEFGIFRSEVESLSSSVLYKNGELIENRAEMFSHLEKIMTSMENAIQALRVYLDYLGTAFSIKKEVFGYPLQVVSSRAEVEEIRSKMGPLSYLTVATSDQEGNLFPLGTISSFDIFKPILGTVSLRDFCNREETKVPSYFEVISVVDHHKVSLGTISSPTALIADSQSANVLVAEASFAINDEYGLSGFSLSEVESQLNEYARADKTTVHSRLLKRVLQKHLNIQRNDPYFVHPQREYLEYLQYLYAILDDTDLLSKVSYRDVLCVASILNRLKTLQLQKETEVIDFDDLPKDEKFASLAAKKILQNEEMYSLYEKVYSLKEEAVETSLRLCIKGEPSSVFADTKVQNGCCRVGQTKLFAKNFPFYDSHAREVRTLWYLDAKSFYEERNDCDLHIHMISTIPGADDVYAGKEGDFGHKDELWIWVPMQEQAIEHLKMFLNAFRNSPQIAKNSIEVEFLGDNAKELEKIFKESFLSFTKRETEKEKKISIPVAILRYKAGLLNSRKAMVSPYLPKLMN